MKQVILAILVVMFSTSVMAHSGGTDGDGCHQNHKTGDYHCHNKK